jgi:galactokinase
VLPIALQVGCSATVRRGGGEVIVRSAQLARQVAIPVHEVRPGAAWITGPDGWTAYAAGVLWALDAVADGWSIELDSTVPLGAGLSSSAAVACSVAVAVDAALGTNHDRAALARFATRSETEFVGAPTGGMDQLVSMHGRAGHALLCDMRSGAVTPIAFAPATDDLALVVVDSRAPHRLVDGEYRSRRAQCAEAADVLAISALRDVDDLDAALRSLPDDLLRRRVRHVVTENARVVRAAGLLRDGDVAGIGPLLTESHASMRDDFEITVPEVDTAVDVLLDQGALGARMTGGGFGGCVIGLVALDAVESAVTAVAESFAVREWARPTWFVAEPSDGAAAELIR